MALVTIPGWGIHHSQHLRPTRFQEMPHQHCCKCKEYDVQPARIVPAKGSLNHPRVALSRDETKSSENHFYYQRCDRHGWRTTIVSASAARLFMISSLALDQVIRRAPESAA